MQTEKTVLIVGGSSGMGRATATLFAEHGHTVVIAGRSREKLQAVQAEISGNVRIEQVDATSAASVADLFARTGRVDHLVLTASAGVAIGSFRDVGVAALSGAFSQKSLAQAQVAQAAIGHLPPDGSITFVSGVAGRRPIAGMSAAGVANAALEALATVLAKEIAPVRVNVVAPGLVDTPAYDGMPADAREAMMRSAAEGLPVGRVGTAEDIAQAIRAVVLNGFITGTCIEVDGGAHL